jgi:uncharacterized protein
VRESDIVGAATRRERTVMKDSINYGKLMHKALRQLIVDVLDQVAEHGLPGQHHFFITFDTRHPGVDMAGSLKARYPDEMTVVMQDWFENLAVMPDRFTVTLNFGNVAEPIVIPFEAIKTFVDPSVEFGLRFDAQEDAASDEEDGDDAEDPPEPRRDRDAEVVSLDQFRKH